MFLSRRKFISNSSAALLCGTSISLSGTQAKAGIAGIFLGVMALSKTIVDMTGKPFRANPAAQRRQADPYMVALTKNREVLRSVHQRLDGVNTALTAIMMQQQMLPQRIDRIVANRIQTMVPTIVRDELGRHRNETYATNLHASINTFIEEVELGIPRNRLDARLDQIREYRNRVIASSGYSALTLCAAMDMELAAMKVLDYSRSQAVVVANVYRSEFVRQKQSLIDSMNEASEHANEFLSARPGELIPTVAHRFLWDVGNGQACDVTPKYASERKTFPTSTDIGPFEYMEGRFELPQTPVTSADCRPINSGCGSRCHDDLGNLRRDQQAWISKYREWEEAHNSIKAFRASLAEIWRTVDRTNTRLGVEMKDWEI